jgi:branched-chain amino acid transport system ATP-binding protein
MLFEAKNVEVGYGKIKALHGVSVHVEAGEVVTLIGANGSGKSTLLKTIAGLLPISGGTLFFEGEKINGWPGHRVTCRGISLIPEGRRIFPLLTVEENLLMGAFTRRDHKAVQEDKEKFFALFPILKDRRQQLGGTLSGGEQQMLAMARALMSRPRLLMLDEPSMGLAPVIVEKVFQLIHDINVKENMTILLVEQNARAALSVATRGYVLETGSVILEGATSNLLTNDRVKQCYLGMEEGHLT